VEKRKKRTAESGSEYEQISPGQGFAHMSSAKQEKVILDKYYGEE
jgi:hypothetical protein